MKTLFLKIVWAVKKTCCKLLWMRNWFWLRSSHPFSLFTVFQPTFSSTKMFFLASAPFCSRSLLATSGNSSWMLSPAGRAGGSALHGSSELTTTCLAPSSVQHPGHCSIFLLLYPRAVQYWGDLPTPARTARGNSCSCGIKLKIHLCEKYLTFSSDRPESYLPLPCFPLLLLLKMIFPNPPHLL